LALTDTFNEATFSALQASAVSKPFRRLIVTAAKKAYSIRSITFDDLGARHPRNIARLVLRGWR
jgi:hypothetical protein